MVSALLQSTKLEYLVIYGRTSMGVPVGELQSTMTPTMDYCLSHLYGDWASDTFFLLWTETWLLESCLAACKRRD